MARPTKAPSDRQSHRLRFTVRPSEYLRIQHAAAQAGLTIPQYLREAVLQRPILITQSRAIDDHVFLEIHRIGVNFNQAVKVMHATGTVAPELLSAAATVERILKANLDDPADRR